MGGSSKPRPEDYAPTEMEKFNAAIAVDASNISKIEPLIVKDIQSASDLKLTQMGKGRAQADFAQALTKNLDMKQKQTLRLPRIECWQEYIIRPKLTCWSKSKKCRY